MQQANKEISEQFSKGNFSFCYDHFTDEVEWKIIGNKTLKGKRDVIDYCNQMSIEMKSASLTNFNIVVENNWIVIQGDCKFVDANNKAAEVSYCDVFHFDNRKIKTITSYCI